jgi:hypothetical protein
MSELNHTFEESQVAARGMGCIIREPKPDELFLDIDSSYDMAIFEKHVTVLGELVRSYYTTPSKSGGDRKHIVVKLSRNVKSLTERVLLQAVLGSDRMRELLSFKRIEAGNRRCTLFFEKAA